MVRGPAIDLVLFDCDGVLVDSELIANEVLAQVLRRQGVAITGTEARTKFVGQSVDAIRDNCARYFGIVMAENWHDEYYRSLLPALAGVRAIPGVLSVVSRLRDAGQMYCVASQGPPEKMEVTLGAAGLLDYFEGRVFSAKSVVRPKPFPDLFLHAASTMDARPGNCVVVEDSALGVEAGISAGMRALAYCSPEDAAAFQELGADTFHAMEDLLQLLGIAA